MRAMGMAVAVALAAFNSIVSAMFASLKVALGLSVESAVLARVYLLSI